VATIAATGVLILLILMLARVGQLQLAPGTKLVAFMGDRITKIPEPGARGDIRDSRGRAMAATHFATRIYIDPTEFPSPPGEAFAKLAGALGMRVDEVAKRIAPKMAINERAKALKTDKDPSNNADAKFCKYLRLGPVLSDSRHDAVKALAIPGVHFESADVRDNPAGGLVAALLGRVGADGNGLMGAELLFNKAVAAASGCFSYVRDASGKPLWVYPGSYKAPERGRDVRVSVDLAIQGIVDEELRKGADEADAAGARCIVLDPRTGEVLALADITRPVKTVDYPWTYAIGQEPGGGGHRPRYTTIRHDNGASELGYRNRCVEDAYEPGSTFKPFMWSEVMSLGLSKPDEWFNTGSTYTTPYGRHIADVHAIDRQTAADGLVNSSNILMTMITARMSYKQMHDAVVRFGFGSRTNIGLPGESTGLVTPLKRWGPYSQSSVAIGHEVAVTPMQMARAFSAFARTGDDAGTLPPIRLVSLDGEEEVVPGQRVLPRNIAELCRQTMRGVTKNLDTKLATWETEKVNIRYEAFGKSGTAEIPLGPPPAGKRRPKGSDGYFQGQYNASFIAGAPVENPRLVVLVVMDDPGPERVATKRHYGARASGPVVRRIIERSLAYLGVPPTYPDSQPDKPGKSVAAADH
jgi:cell division protein FtsI/penicillin-binding protein 2